jgi:hypothetical protein
MAEAMIEGGDLQSYGRETVSVSVENDPIVARRGLYDALRPPDEEADIIRERVREIAVSEIKKYKNHDYKRMIEIASGIFLWQQMMYDTGESLPLGLCFQYDPIINSPTGYYDVGINNQVISMQDYAFVMDLFRQQGLLEEVAKVQQRHKEANKELITASVEQYIRSSFITEYFAAYDIGEGTIPRQKSSHIDLSEERVLHERFVARHGSLPDSGASGSLLASYSREVRTPLLLSRQRQRAVPNDADARQKKSFRRYIESSYFAHTLYAETIASGEKVIVRDGEFWFPKRDDNGSIIYEQNANDRDRNGYSFLWREVYSSATDYGVLTDWGNALGKRTLKQIIPRLYDPQDTRSFQEIVDEGICAVSQAVASEIVAEPFVSLDEVVRHNADVSGCVFRQMGRNICLSGVKRSPYGYKQYEEIGSPWKPITINGESHEFKNGQNGEILFATPEVFSIAPHMILNGSRRIELPTIPDTVDLCLRLADSLPLSMDDPSTGNNTVTVGNCDPHIPGMKLVARNGDLFYFRRTNDTLYERNKTHIPELKKIQIAALARAIKMSEFADALMEMDNPTFAELCDLVNRYSSEGGIVPHHEKVVQRPTDLARLNQVQADGKLYGMQACVYFLRAVSQIALDGQVKSYSIESVNGYSLNASGVGGQAGQVSVGGINFGAEYHVQCFIDPFSPEPSLPHTEQQQTRSASWHDASVYPAARVAVPGSAEIAEQRQTHLGRVVSLNPSVLEHGKFRLMQPRLRNVYTRLPEQIENPDLVIEITDTQFLDGRHEPFIYGMKLVARHEQVYSFRRDDSPQAPSYQLPAKEVSLDQIKELLSLFHTLGLQSSKEKLLGRYHSSPFILREAIEAMASTIHGYAPESGTALYDLEGPYSLAMKELIDEQGKIRGGDAVSAHFLYSVLAKMYGEDSLSYVHGFAITADETINALPRTMVRLQIPARDQFPEDSVDCLLSIGDDTVTSEAYRPYEKKPPFVYHSRPSPSPLEDPLAEAPEEGSMRIFDSTEWDKMKRTHIGNVLFAEPSVFDEVDQRLITRSARDHSLPTTDPKFSNTHVYLEITDPRLADESHDPYIEGLSLIARDGNLCCFQLDPGYTLYRRVENPIDTGRQAELAKYCREEWCMAELASDIEASEVLTISGVKDLARKYVRGWVPREGAESFYVENPADIVLKGLVGQDGILRGTCGTFEYFLRSLSRCLYGDDAVHVQTGYSLNLAQQITIMTHAQTRLTVPEEGIDVLLDIEPDPSKAEIASDVFEERSFPPQSLHDVIGFGVSTDQADLPEIIPPAHESLQDSDAFVLPEPDSAGTHVSVFQAGVPVEELKGEEALAFWRQMEGDTHEQELRQECQATSTLFRRLLLGYLGETIDSDFNTLEQRMHSELHKASPDVGQGKIDWGAMPLHIQLYRWLRGYMKVTAVEHPSGGSFSVDLLALVKAQQALISMRSGEMNVAYNPSFISAMGHLINAYTRVGESGSVKMR